MEVELQDVRVVELLDVPMGNEGPVDGDEKIKNRTPETISKSALPCSTPRTMVNFLKSFIGSGILGLPFAFYSGGIVFSMAGMILMGLLSNYCIRLLVQCAVDLEPKYGKLSFGGIGTTLFGAKVGFCCAYVIYISTNLEGTFGFIPAWGYVLLLLPAFVLSSWIRSFRILAIVSLTGQVTGYIGMLAIMIFALVSTVQNTPPLAAFNPPGMAMFFGMAVFAYGGIGLVIPIRFAMISPKAYPLVLDLGFIFIIVISLLFGVVGYSGYGSGIDPNSIAMNLPQDSSITTVIQVTMMISIFCSYPVQMFPVSSIFEGLLFTQIPFFAAKNGMEKEHIRNLLRMLIVVFTSIVAFSIPHFSLFIGLVGSIGGSMTAFIIPATFHLKLFYHRTPLHMKIYHIGILFFGIAAGIISGGITSLELITVLNK